MLQSAFKKRPTAEARNGYATHSDFCAIFQEQLDSLFLLALLLTGDELSAEKCFLAAFESCAEERLVFKESAASWSRRSVIKTAIRFTSPTPSDPSSSRLAANRSNLNVDQDSSLKCAQQPGSPARGGFSCAGVEELPLFDRFVFVMSVLERYSDRECAILLGCPAADILPARIRAFQQISKIEKSYPNQSIGDQVYVVNPDWLECG